MLMETDSGVRVRPPSSGTFYRLAIAGVCVLAAILVFRSALAELVQRWQTQEEYSYGFLIPPIVGWLLWSRRDALVASIGQPSLIGLALIAIAGGMHVVGELSALFIFSQVGFVVTLFGIVLGLGGYSLLRVVFVPIIFLLFAIPLPYFLDASLSWRLQLVSSELGVLFIRLLQIPVFLQGNVIDLGTYKVQVVEACSGLRYLYPLLSLSFLAAYLFQAPFWQRALIFLSAIPITIAMNSLRIGLVGVMVDRWGPQDADGLLHMFEGWVIFVACAAILIAEMAALARFASGKSFFELFYPPVVEATPKPQVQRGQALAYASPIACLVLLGAVGLAGLFVTTRSEVYPERRSFAAFPNSFGEWRGRSSSIPIDVQKGLGFSDYIISDFAKPDGRPVNFYVAYYSSQRSGISPHSPSVCIPGNGWQITEFERIDIRNNDKLLPINRAIIMRGSDKQLVYYWYEERGVTLANEYLSKVLLLKDAILENRTDGALIRLITPVFQGESEQAADARLREFASKVTPTLVDFLPKPPSVSAATTMPLKSTAHQ
jgi:exosortase D (VPLPA-CTERM-specific)